VKHDVQVRRSGIRKSRELSSVSRFFQIYAELNLPLARLTLILAALASLTASGFMSDTIGAARVQNRRKTLGSAYDTCEYDSVRTDWQGRVADTYHRSTKCFDENLGNGVTLRMIEIPEGDFVMGSPETDYERNPDEGPQYKVHVPRFFMGETVVSEEQYKAMQKRPRIRWKLADNLATDWTKYIPRVSADGVSWEQATEFCARLAALTGKPYRLPSEAEWEYAERAGGNDDYEFGPEPASQLLDDRQIRDSPGIGRISHPFAVGSVGSPNGFGLKDVTGSEEQWVLDVYHRNYIGAPVDGTPWYDSSDPKGKDLKQDRVMRGGSYGSRRETLRSAARWHWPVTGVWVSGNGFRIAVRLPEE